MRARSWMLLVAAPLLLLLILRPKTTFAQPYQDQGDDYTDDYIDNSVNGIMDSAQKRGCVPRDGSCEHRRYDCCYNSSCRCNLWGTNCRCQRMGLFQYLRG